MEQRSNYLCIWECLVWLIIVYLRKRDRSEGFAQVFFWGEVDCGRIGTKEFKPSIMQKLAYDSSDFWKRFYFITGLLGIFSIILEIDIYRVTIIRVSIPITIILIVGLISFILIRKNYYKTYSIKNIFFPLVQSIISWGFIACYVFMATNYYLANKNVQEYTFPIEQKGSMIGSKYHRDERSPLVIFNYLGEEKELVFKYVDTKKVNEADSVYMKIKKGFLGFDILDSYDVIIKP